MAVPQPAREGTLPPVGRDAPGERARARLTDWPSLHRPGAVSLIGRRDHLGEAAIERGQPRCFRKLDATSVDGLLETISVEVEQDPQKILVLVVDPETHELVGRPEHRCEGAFRIPGYWRTVVPAALHRELHKTR